MKLFVFDFDDTLARTTNVVHVLKADGRRLTLTSSEYLKYDKEETDVFDFDDFTRPRDAEATPLLRLFERVVDNHGTNSVAILTARTRPEPVWHFFQQYGLPRVEVMALGKPITGSHPDDKKEWISWVVQKFGVTSVHFFDDHPENVNAVQSLSSLFKNKVSISAHLVDQILFDNLDKFSLELS